MRARGVPCETLVRVPKKPILCVLSVVVGVRACCTKARTALSENLKEG